MIAQESALLSPARTARLLQVTPQRVAQLRRAGLLPAVETDLGHLFRREDVERLAAARARGEGVRRDLMGKG